MLPFTWTGKGFKAAPVPSMTQNTSAQGVVQPLMELTGVLKCRKIKALTPYHPKAWEDEFCKAGLSEKYSHIITGLHYSFHISLPLINNTQSPPNKDSVVEFSGEFNRIVQSKIQKGCYIGPISRWNMETHSNPHPFLSFWNQDKSTNAIIFRTTHPQAPPLTTSWTHPSTHRSTQTCSLQHGAHLLSSHFSYTDCYQAHNWPLEMLQKPTESFLSITPSGHPQLSTWEMMCSQLTLHWPLGQVLQLGHTAQLEMQPQTFCSSKGLDQSPVGSMITYSSRSHVVHLQSTTRNAGHGTETSFPEVSTKMEVESGSEEGDLKMEHLKNLMKTAPFLARTFQCSQIDQWKTCHTPTTLVILTLHHGCWGSHGRSQRTVPSLVQQPTLVSTGTLKPIEYLWQIARKRNTSRWQRIGFCKPHICLKRWRNSTANSYMHALSGLLDEHISQSWSACLEYSTIVHSYHALVQGDFKKSWNGGLTSFNNPSCQGQSLSLFPSMIWMPSQMQALNSESWSPLETSGGHGASSQAGRHLMDSEISDGQRPLPLNAWSGTSQILTVRNNTSWCMATTEELLKVGGMGGAAVDQSMKSSRDCMNFPVSVQLGPLSTQCMLGANSILQTHPPEGYIHQNPFSFHQCNSHQSSITSSLTHDPLSQQLNYVSEEKSHSTGQPKDGVMMLTQGLAIVHDNVVCILAKNLPIPTDNSLTKFNQPLPTGRVEDGSNCKAYQTNLVPLPSIFRPYCLAWDQLRLWCPSSPWSNRIGNVEISEPDLKRILDVINVSWAKGTKEVYGASLLVYHVFCDLQNISDKDRIPTSPILIISFIGSCVGLYMGTTLANYVFAVCAWHILHGHSWNMNNMQVKAALTGAAIQAPPTSKHPQRALVTVDLMEWIFCGLNIAKPLDTAVTSCFSMVFYSVAHTGEFMLPTLSTFNPTWHVKLSDISNRLDHNNLEVTVFHLPKIKCSSEGEDVFWSWQNGITDPKATLKNHFQINDPPADGPLFAYRHC